MKRLTLTPPDPNRPVYGFAAALRRVNDAPDATAAQDWAWLDGMDPSRTVCAHCKDELKVWEWTLNRQVHCELCAAKLHHVEVSPEEAAAQYRHQVLAECGVAPLYQSMHLGTWHGRQPAELAAFIASPRGVWYIHGAPGRGKSHLAVAALERIKATRPTLWAVWRDCREVLVAAKRSLPVESPDLRLMRECALLVLDDMGAERGTDFEADIIGGVLRYRHMQALPAIVTSNLSPDALRMEAPALASRITSGLETALGGRDRRAA